MIDAKIVCFNRLFFRSRVLKEALVERGRVSYHHQTKVAAAVIENAHTRAARSRAGARSSSGAAGKREGAGEKREGPAVGRGVTTSSVRDHKQTRSKPTDNRSSSSSW